MDKKGKTDSTKKKKLVGNFIIDFNQMLGSGQYAEVYKAINQQNNTEVAVKIINRQQIHQDEYIQNATYRQIEIMKNLENPNIIQFLGYIQSKNNIYIFQELATNGTLSQILKYQKLDQKTAIEYIIQLLKGFSELIKHGIIHRDIKPTNILVKQKILKISDFGFSRHIQISKSMNSIVGTPVYMAPQILQTLEKQNCKYTYKCDIWSFGVLCYEMVSGCRPWKNSNINNLLNKIKEQITKGIQFPEGVQISEDLKDLILGCIKYQEKDRYQWVQIFRHKLFKDQFKDIQFKNQSKMGKNFVLTQIRLKVHCNNINLEKLLTKFPQKLNKQEFINFLKIIDDQITQKQCNNLFTYSCNKTNQIQKKALLKILQNHGIKLAGFQAKNLQPNDPNNKIQYVMNILQKKLEQKQIDLYELLSSFDIRKKNTIYLQQFTSFIKSFYPNATSEQINQIFLHFNPVNLKGIRLNSLYERLCKIIQVPAVINGNTSKKLKQNKN